MTLEGGVYCRKEKRGICVHACGKARGHAAIQVRYPISVVVNRRPLKIRHSADGTPPPVLFGTERCQRGYRRAPP